MTDIGRASDPPTGAAHRFRTAASAARRFVVRRIALPILRMGPPRHAMLSLARFRYRLESRLGSVADWMLTVATPTSDERAASMEALVDLFFDLSAAAAVNVFVEAGAKEASASRRAADAGIPEVIAFEANPYTYRRFVAQLEAAGLDYRHLALSEDPGDVSFLVRRRKDGSPIADGQGSLLVRPDHAAGYEEVTVRAARIDDEIPADGRVAMWVDVEGAVAEVLSGAPGALGRCDVLIVEAEQVEVWKGQRWLARDIVEHLARFGLRAVARDMQNRWQFNIVFVRDSLLRNPTVEAPIAVWRATQPPMR